ncbi:MAG TPA: hypothetical protein V6C89_06675 [Drouetiella sp.]|jgi:hypothetical protein
MANRKLKQKIRKTIVKKAGLWALKTVLSSLPVVGTIFKIVISAVEFAREIFTDLEEEVIRLRPARARKARLAASAA